MKRIVSIVAIGVLVGAGLWGYSYVRSRGSAPAYRVTRVDRGPVTAAVSATGNLNAVITVQVGSQVSGQIKELLAQVDRARADVENARAAAVEGTAQTAKAQVGVLDSKRTFDRNAALFGRDLIAASDRDIARAASDSARIAGRARERTQATITEDDALALEREALRYE